MLVSVVTTVPAVIPAGHRVEVVWYVEAADPSRELAEPRVLDLDTSVEYSHRVHHLPPSWEGIVSDESVPVDVRSDLRRIRTLRGTVRRCFAVNMGKPSHAETRVTLLVEPHAPSTPYR